MGEPNLNSSRNDLFEIYQSSELREREKERERERERERVMRRRRRKSNYGKERIVVDCEFSLSS